MKKPHWTEQEEEFIRVHASHMSDAQLAAFLPGRSEHCVLKKRTRLGILRKVPVRVPELMHAVNNPNLNGGDIADDLGCTIWRGIYLRQLANRFAA